MCQRKSQTVINFVKDPLAITAANHFQYGIFFFLIHVVDNLVKSHDHMNIKALAHAYGFLWGRLVHAIEFLEMLRLAFLRNN